MEIRVENLEKSFEGASILKKISFMVAKKECVGIIGPNGSGKSTLLKCMYRVLKADHGSIFLNGKNLHAMSIRQSALQQAVLAQHNRAVFDFTVEQVVLMGRNPHKRMLESYNDEDYCLVRQCLDDVGMLAYEKHSFARLSGGEQQRVMLARALAQATPCLVLDEPTNHLDIRFQLQIMDCVRKRGITVIAAIHDLNIAAAYCDRIIALKHGKIVGEGVPGQLLTPNFIYMLYEVKAEILYNSQGRPVIAYPCDCGNCFT